MRIRAVLSLVLSECSLTSVVLFDRWKDLYNVYLLADIEQSSGCASKVTARGRPIGWKSMAQHTLVWIETPTDKGPSACR